MVTITMKKNEEFFHLGKNVLGYDVERIVWAKERFGDNNVSFKEPMQLTFKNEYDRIVYGLVWGE